jgi:feruloyl esterase
MLDIPIHPYPEKTIWNEIEGFGKEVGPRGGVERVAERFLPSATL